MASSNLLTPLASLPSLLVEHSITLIPTFCNMSSSPLTAEELKWFHTIDRELFGRLVISLKRNILQSMQILAFWMWLEELGYPNIILKMRNMPDVVINSIANEAMVFLNCLEPDKVSPPSVNNDIPWTVSLLGRHISVQYFYHNRLTAIHGITNFMNNVCVPAFDDIIQKALAIAQDVRMAEGGGVGNVGEASSSTTRFPLPGGVGAPQHMGERRTANVEPRPRMIDEDLPDGRTMFITFSRGYHLSEGEVANLFISEFGDCLEAIYMQQVPPNVQPLYAKAVFKSASTIELILQGKEKAKYGINKKDFYVRPYISRRSSAPPPPPTSA